MKSLNEFAFNPLRLRESMFTVSLARARARYFAKRASSASVNSGKAALVSVPPGP